MFLPGKLYGVLLEKVGTLDDCYVTTTVKSDAKITDFALVTISPDQYFVCVNKSVWMHQIKSEISRRSEQIMAFRSED